MYLLTIAFIAAILCWKVNNKSVLLKLVFNKFMRIYPQLGAFNSFKVKMPAENWTIKLFYVLLKVPLTALRNYLKKYKYSTLVSINVWYYHSLPEDYL